MLLKQFFPAFDFKKVKKKQQPNNIDIKPN